MFIPKDKSTILLYPITRMTLSLDLTKDIHTLNLLLAWSNKFRLYMHRLWRGAHLGRIHQIVCDYHTKLTEQDQPGKCV